MFRGEILATMHALSLLRFILLSSCPVRHALFFIISFWPCASYDAPYVHQVFSLITNLSPASPCSSRRAVSRPRIFCLPHSLDGQPLSVFYMARDFRTYTTTFWEEEVERITSGKWMCSVICLLLWFLGFPVFDIWLTVCLSLSPSLHLCLSPSLSCLFMHTHVPQDASSNHHRGGVGSHRTREARQVRNNDLPRSADA